MEGPGSADPEDNGKRTDVEIPKTFLTSHVYCSSFSSSSWVFSPAKCIQGCIVACVLWPRWRSLLLNPCSWSLCHALCSKKGQTQMFCPFYYGKWNRWQRMQFPYLLSPATFSPNLEIAIFCLEANHHTKKPRLRALLNNSVQSLGEASPWRVGYKCRPGGIRRSPQSSVWP